MSHSIRIGLLLLVAAPCALAQDVIAPAIPVRSQNTAYIKAVHRSLELLRARSPKDYELALAHVGRIDEVERWEQVGMAVMAEPPVASFQRRQVLGSSTWLASIIVHEACHRSQYLRAVKRHGSRFVPNEEFYGRNAELECLGQQAEVLERIGAPAREIAQVRNEDGRHYLRDEYGNYRKGR